MQENNENTEKRRKEFAGKVIKCPACGMEITSFTAICPACGHELNSSKISEEVASFIEQIDSCDRLIANNSEVSKKGWGTWNKWTKIAWVIINVFTSCIPLVIYFVLPSILTLLGVGTPAFSTEEKRKATIIENYAFPNERESLLEALVFVKAKMAFLASQKYTRKTVYWMRLWNTKAEQINQKVEILLQGDAIAQTTYADIGINKNYIEKKVRFRAIAGSAAIIVLILIAVINGSLLTTIGKLLPGGDKVSTAKEFEWLDTGLSVNIPKPELTHGEIKENSSSELEIELEDISYNQYDDYVDACIEKGYSGEAERDTDTYVAFSESGYKLKLAYSKYFQTLNIGVMAPFEGEEDFEWSDSKLANITPKINANVGQVKTDIDTTYEVLLSDVSSSEFVAYMDLCEEEGFTIDAERKEDFYIGFNLEGYKIDTYIDEMKIMNIMLTAPMEMEKITWPKSKITKILPKLDVEIGNITSNSEDWFIAYIGNVTIAEFNDYVDKCLDKGFDADYSRHDKILYGENKDGVDLTIEYKGGNVIWISAHTWK